MPAEFHPTPSLIPLLPHAFPSKPSVIAAGEIQSHVSFRTPLPVGFQWPEESGSIFQLPDLLSLQWKRLPVFTSYRNAVRLLKMDRGKMKLIRLIQLRPMARPFYLFTYHLFNRLENWFPSHSKAGSFLRNFRARYE